MRFESALSGDDGGGGALRTRGPLSPPDPRAAPHPRHLKLPRGSARTVTPSRPRVLTQGKREDGSLYHDPIGRQGLRLFRFLNHRGTRDGGCYGEGLGAWGAGVTSGRGRSAPTRSHDRRISGDFYREGVGMAVDGGGTGTGTGILGEGRTGGWVPHGSPLTIWVCGVTVVPRPGGGGRPVLAFEGRVTSEVPVPPSRSTLRGFSAVSEDSRLAPRLRHTGDPTIGLERPGDKKDRRRARTTRSFYQYKPS